jgi:hypothetical protein
VFATNAQKTFRERRAVRRQQINAQNVKRRFLAVISFNDAGNFIAKRVQKMFRLTIFNFNAYGYIMNLFRRIMARAKNDAGERIESLRFSVPALRVGVLEYGAGQLQTNNTALDGKPVKLYYPPEAVSDEKFLKSLETAPVVVGGHDSTTNEQNKKIDGWAHSVNYDDTMKAAMINGVVKGAKEVAYVKSNIGNTGFGASAFVDIYNLKVENGMTPDGQAYDAIAGELRATHVALAPHVRDPENKIRVANAVCINTAGEIKNTEENNVEMTDAQIALMVKNMAVEMARGLAVKNASFGGIFYRKQNGNAVLFHSDGSRVTKLDANVYPVGSSLSVRYEHPGGIELTLSDARKLGIPEE